MPMKKAYKKMDKMSMPKMAKKKKLVKKSTPSKK